MMSDPDPEDLEYIERGRQLREFRESPGYGALRDLLFSRLSQLFDIFCHSRKDDELLAAAHEGRGLFSILESIDSAVSRAQDLGRELVERAEAERRAEETRKPPLGPEWNRQVRSHPRGRMG